MLVTASCLLLSSQPYSETSLIIRAYTREFGLQSFIGKGLRVSKGRRKNLSIRPLHFYEVIYNKTANGGLHVVREIKPGKLYTSIDGHYEKTAITLFICEVLQKTLREESADEGLYDFIEASLLWLDASEDFLDFHPRFLLALTRFLGFAPTLNYSDTDKFFEPADGIFVSAAKAGYTLGERESESIYRFSRSMNFSEKLPYSLTNSDRRHLLRALVNFFQLHVEGFNNVKSLDVLETVFAW